MAQRWYFYSTKVLRRPAPSGIGPVRLASPCTRGRRGSTRPAGICDRGRLRSTGTCHPHWTGTGKENVRTDEPTDGVGTKILETLIQLHHGRQTPIGLRVDAFILTGPS